MMGEGGVMRGIEVRVMGERKAGGEDRHGRQDARQDGRG